MKALEKKSELEEEGTNTEMSIVFKIGRIL